jgi:hypothetical protein
VLELLLVTPISVEQIIYRQVCGFWRRFLPPVLLQLGLAKLMIILDMANSGGYSFQAFLLLNLLTIPLIGFYSSARFQNFTAAALSTAFFSLALPLFWPDLGPGFIERLASLDLWFLQEYASPAVASDALPIVSGFLQLIAAAVCGCWLWQSLLHRSFLPSQAA